MTLIPDAIEAALDGRQLQPVLLGAPASPGRLRGGRAPAEPPRGWILSPSLHLTPE